MTSIDAATTTVMFVEAVRAALRQAMIENDRVVLLGEDVGNLGGVFRASEGLKQEFGAHRVIDTPMAELSIVGMSIGMALRGLRPIAEIQFADFIWAAADQIFSEAPKIHFRTNGQWSVPLVIRVPWGAGIHGALYHSQSIEAPLCHFPGLKVVAASSAADAAGLLLSAVDDPNPVIVLEHKLAYRRVSGTLAEPIARTPIGTLAVAREGTDVTVVVYGWMVHEAVAAAERLDGRGRAERRSPRPPHASASRSCRARPSTPLARAASSSCTRPHERWVSARRSRRRSPSCASTSSMRRLGD